MQHFSLKVNLHFNHFHIWLCYCSSSNLTQKKHSYTLPAVIPNIKKGVSRTSSSKVTYFFHLIKHILNTIPRIIKNNAVEDYLQLMYGKSMPR